MFGVIFWTPPHFWALALWRCLDHAGVPMLPVVSGETETKRQILIYSLIMAPLGVAPVAFGVGGLVYAGFATLLGAIFIVGAVVLRAADDDFGPAKQLFGISIFYLFALERFGGCAVVGMSVATNDQQKDDGPIETADQMRPAQ